PRRATALGVWSLGIGHSRGWDEWAMMRSGRQQRLELLQPAWNGLPRVWGGFVFQRDVALVVCVAQELHHSRQVCWLLRMAAPMNFDFDLDVYRVWCATGKVGVGVVGLEIA